MLYHSAICYVISNFLQYFENFLILLCIQYSGVIRKVHVHVFLCHSQYFKYMYRLHPPPQCGYTYAGGGGTCLWSNLIYTRDVHKISDIFLYSNKPVAVGIVWCDVRENHAHAWVFSPPKDKFNRWHLALIWVCVLASCNIFMFADWLKNLSSCIGWDFAKGFVKPNWKLFGRLKRKQRASRNLKSGTICLKMVANRWSVEHVCPQ